MENGSKNEQEMNQVLSKIKGIKNKLLDQDLVWILFRIHLWFQIQIEDLFEMISLKTSIKNQLEKLSEIYLIKLQFETQRQKERF